MRREAWLEPGVMRTVDDHDRFAALDYSLEDLERYVIDKYGPGVLDLSA